MLHRTLTSAAVCFLTICFLVPCAARADNADNLKKDKQQRSADVFIQVLADRLQQKPEEIEKLWMRGYGRNELIKLILISRKSGKELKEVVRRRDKGTKLSRMAQEYNFDYPSLLREAAAVREELDYQVSISTPTPTKIRYSTSKENADQ